MMSFMEYMIEQQEIPENFDVKLQRTRLALSLYKHGSKYTEENLESDEEYLRTLLEDYYLMWCLNLIKLD